MPGGSSLPQFLAEHLGVRNIKRLPSLHVAQILIWADAFQKQWGRPPGQKSGAIAESPGDTWACGDRALRLGSRGLPGGSSLAKCLDQHRRPRNRKKQPLR